MAKMLKIHRFDANYDRKGVIEFGFMSCDVCKKKNIFGVAIDSSDDEYGPGSCCIVCIQEAYKELEKEHANNEKP